MKQKDDLKWVLFFPFLGFKWDNEINIPEFALIIKNLPLKELNVDMLCTVFNSPC